MVKFCSDRQEEKKLRTTDAFPNSITMGHLCQEDFVGNKLLFE